MRRVASLPEAQMPAVVALGSISHLGPFHQVVSKAKASTMVVHANAILVLEDLRHHVGSGSLSFALAFLVIWLPLVPLLVLP